MWVAAPFKHLKYFGGVVILVFDHTGRNEATVRDHIFVFVFLEDWVSIGLTFYRIVVTRQTVLSFLRRTNDAPEPQASYIAMMEIYEKCM